MDRIIYCYEISYICQEYYIIFLYRSGAAKKWLFKTNIYLMEDDEALNCRPRFHVERWSTQEEGVGPTRPCGPRGVAFLRASTSALSRLIALAGESKPRMPVETINDSRKKE